MGAPDLSSHFPFLSLPLFAPLGTLHQYLPRNFPSPVPVLGTGAWHQHHWSGYTSNGEVKRNLGSDWNQTSYYTNGETVPGTAVKYLHWSPLLLRRRRKRIKTLFTNPVPFSLYSAAFYGSTLSVCPSSNQKWLPGRGCLSWLKLLQLPGRPFNNCPRHELTRQDHFITKEPARLRNHFIFGLTAKEKKKTF